MTKTLRNVVAFPGRARSLPSVPEHLQSDLQSEGVGGNSDRDQNNPPKGPRRTKPTLEIVLRSKKANPALLDPDRYYGANNLMLRVEKRGVGTWVSWYTCPVRHIRTSLTQGYLHKAPSLTWANAKSLNDALQLRVAGGADPRKPIYIPGKLFGVDLDAFLAKYANAKKPDGRPKWSNEWLANWGGTLRSENYGAALLGIETTLLTADHLVAAVDGKWGIPGSAYPCEILLSKVGEIVDWTRSLKDRAWAKDWINPTIVARARLDTYHIAVQSHPALPVTHQQHVWRLLWELTDMPAGRLLLVLMMTPSGRISEYRHAVWADFDFETNVWTVPHSKNGQIQYKPIHPKLKAFMLGFRPIDWKPTDKVFFSGYERHRRLGRVVGVGTLLALLDKVALQVGITLDLPQDPDDPLDYVSHSFRNGFSTFVTKAKLLHRYRWTREEMLAHKVKEKVEGTYDRETMLAERAELTAFYIHWLDTGEWPQTVDSNINIEAHRALLRQQLAALEGL